MTQVLETEPTVTPTVTPAAIDTTAAAAASAKMLRVPQLQALTNELHRFDDDVYALNIALANAAEGIVRVDVDGRFKWVNAAYCRIVGYMPDELIGRRLDEVPGLCVEEDLDVQRRAMVTMLEKGSTIVDVRGCRPDGTLYYKQITIVPAVDRLNAFTGHFRFVHDISHRKRNEDNVVALLREIEYRNAAYRAMVEGAYEAIITCDAEGNVANWEGAATRLFGYGRDEAVGKPLTSLIVPAGHIAESHAAAFKTVMQPQAESAAAAAAADASPPVRKSILRTEAVRKDGVRVPVELTLSLWTVEGKRFCTGFVREVCQTSVA